jgi:hypothetical protein
MASANDKPKSRFVYETRVDAKVRYQLIREEKARKVEINSRVMIEQWINWGASEEGTQDRSFIGRSWDTAVLRADLEDLFNGPKV